jgi:hypothetical protein
VSGPAVFLRKRPGKFGTRIEGYGQSKKVWTCRRCRAWHDAPKPKACERCAHSTFLHFDSAGEARWFVGLMRELDHGLIAELQHHPRYPIHVCQVDVRAHIQVFEYVADADYERDGELITADFKPRAAQGLDPVFKLKRKCFEAQYGRLITVVTER